ncbi:helix-turn-helix transcriptional regulator [Lactobacillus salivarius]|uniref:Helix-turn-helix transcriptional regulator n=1 Tax=Ligilactobacillus salivarius TaxID=1624 RepID=A0ABD6JDQ9_9LACO|nr:helix-turn-helix transcriptional regulator [Ligilactobacillus salivarius]MYU60054.1 helix-turn-helix transcriptional regulator [Ligilactobacillus salivarius]MYU85619.1 helix-turn-helix transcriptional regulator [Ligilactobacillus salivarius]MYU87201.1 helix-turn-helix transcriptional regulator [Ligilactobacillus salivarius]MYY45234.1 helix-turn-helix transcriptional regulator [Ligilactobacillus salivarius]MYZ67012.1 helix-turn-helix transcriptional regulator [Ligilactobacillus salivarius]
MDTNKIYKITVRMPKELRENLTYAANKLNITSNTFMKISLYSYLNLSLFSLADAAPINISKIPKDRSVRINLIVDDELHTILEIHAQKYNLTINDLILYTILVSLNDYDEFIKNNINNFQSRLKIAIENKGISQAELARRSGLSRASITDYLKGKYKAKPGAIYSLAQALDVDTFWLLGYQNNNL